MGLYKRGSVYWYKFEVRGRLYRDTTRTSNQRAAKTIMDDARLDVISGKTAIKQVDQVTLGEFHDRFMDEIRLKCSEHERTIVFYEYKYKNLLNFTPLKNALLNQIDEAMITKFSAQMIKDGYTRATVNRCLDVLKRVLRLACRWNLINRVPRIELLKGENEREFILSREVEPKYIAALPEWMRLFAMLALQTGMRRKELIDLRWDDIHWEPTGNAVRGYIHVRGTKSKNSSRNITMTDAAKNILLRLKEKSTCELVFTRPGTVEPEPLSETSITKTQQAVRKKLGLGSEFVIHSLRHTFGTRLGESGAEAFTIMKIMGHSSISVSQKYVHPTPETLERAILALERSPVQKVGTKSYTVRKPRVVEINKPALVM